MKCRWSWWGAGEVWKGIDKVRWSVGEDGFRVDKAQWGVVEVGKL